MIGSNIILEQALKSVVVTYIMDADFVEHLSSILTVGAGCGYRLLMILFLVSVT